MTGAEEGPPTSDPSVGGSPTNVTIATWNLQGSKGLDVDAVAGLLAAACADVVVLQEVQRRQARQLGDRLQMSAGARWVFKHWPVVSRAEGLAVFTPHRLVASRSVVVRRRPWWSWKRRVIVVARIGLPDGEIEVVDVHLSPHDELDRRSREAQTVLSELSRSLPTFVVGDLNDSPGDGAHRTFTDAGLGDAWAVAATAEPGTGATNWTAGDRTGRRPTQRIDFVFLPDGWSPRAVLVGDGAAIERFAELSDHLPVVVSARGPDGWR